MDGKKRIKLVIYKKYIRINEKFTGEMDSCEKAEGVRCQLTFIESFEQSFGSKSLTEKFFDDFRCRTFSKGFHFFFSEKRLGSQELLPNVSL